MKQEHKNLLMNKKKFKGYNKNKNRNIKLIKLIVKEIQKMIKKQIKEHKINKIIKNKRNQTKLINFNIGFKRSKQIVTYKLNQII